MPGDDDEADAPVTRIRAYVPDLMDRSKLAAPRPGIEVDFVTGPAALAGGAGPAPDLIVVDLSRAGVIEVLPGLAATGVRIIGFVSHVDRQTADAAAAAGCSQVYPRSAFFGRLGQLLR